MGQMYTVFIRGNKTVQTYAESIQEAIDKVLRCKEFKVDIDKTKKFYNGKQRLI